MCHSVRSSWAKSIAAMVLAQKYCQDQQQRFFWSFSASRVETELGLTQRLFQVFYMTPLTKHHHVHVVVLDPAAQQHGNGWLLSLNCRCILGCLQVGSPGKEERLSKHPWSTTQTQPLHARMSGTGAQGVSPLTSRASPACTTPSHPLTKSPCGR